MSITCSTFWCCSKFVVPACKISCIFENEEKFSICFNKIQFFIQYIENKKVFAILHKIFTFGSELIKIFKF